MSSERNVQNFIHRLEEGSWVTGVRIAALAFVCLAALVILVFDPFFWGLYKGISHPRALEQAVIAREVARGNGFSTKMIRPLEVGHFIQNEKPLPENVPQTYHAPLWPATLAPVLLAFKSKWAMQQSDYIYLLDKVISVFSILLFYASIVISFFTIRRLFDSKIAWLTTGLTLISIPLWKGALSGLPNMLMLFLFSAASYAALRAIEARAESKSPMRWLCVTAALFGLLALSHAVTIWLFLGFLVFAGFYFGRPHIVLPILMAIFLAFYSPWLVRNYRVSGNPLGVSVYSVLYQVRGSEGNTMREFRQPRMPTPFIFRSKVQTGFSDQVGAVVRNLGGNLVAPLFFLALLHLFRRREVSVGRWLFFSMWIAAAAGSSLFRSDDLGADVSASDLNFLFIPVFSAYGLAFLLILWGRLELRLPLLRNAFLALVFLVSLLPITTYFGNLNKVPFNWPPYVPPYISLLGAWTTENEIIASDMPWAVSWYADRKSLWIPNSLTRFIKLHDYNELGTPLAGLYLTPLSGNKALLSDILKGEYKEWAPFILRTTNLDRFPFQKILPMPIDNQCVFYSDHERWAASLKQKGQ